MSTLAKVTFKTAQEVCKLFPLGDESKALAKDGQTPKQLIDLLAEKQQWPDAIKLLAHALPKREAVWWACLVARQTYGTTNVPPKIAAAIAAAEKWVSDPSENNRQATFPAAEAAELGNPAGCAAIAAFWSGGSLAPPTAPVVPPGELLTAHGVSGGIVLAAVMNEPQKSAEKFKKFLALGVDVASGANKWK